MTMGSENLGNGSAKPERFTGKYRGARRDSGNTTVEEPSMAVDLGPSEGSGSERVSDLPDSMDLPGNMAPPDRGPTLPSLDMGGLTEPVFPPAGWPDVPSEPLVDHPLLRGLLLELPPKGTIPGSLWLDRWFEAARAILELLYVQDSSRSR
ncbi:hypothetical protein I0C86_24805 [Plantactinospora sp. S1510]|uniref:Uncharacterized protein n=1 Tax=Plantactinospora alkalitolerans TaxID=2789879 RepID=A0ABS0H1U9_9ACTN|nr:hypothetical protein [Plantactinospora alkalitolerans]MBF9132144.1 hypothetical protein [Plantactinospora alkalitolerans]